MTGGSVTIARPGAWVAAALLALFGLRLLIAAGSGASLHVDEAQYWDWSRALQWGYYSKPPAIAALIALSTTLFGDSESGLRALAMACYPATALVLWRLGGDIESSVPPGERRGIGSWAAAIFATSPIAALLGLVATTDALLILCWALALWALWHAVVARRQWAWAGWALACGVGLLDKYTMAALLPGAALFVWRAGHRRAWVGFAAANAVALLAWAPNLMWNAAAGWPTLRHTAEITVQAERARSLGAALGDWATFALAQPLILAPLLLPALAFAGRRWRGAAAPWPASAAALLGWTSLPLATVGLLQAFGGHAEVNWIAPVHVAASLALALAWAPRTRVGTRGWAVLLAAQCLMVTALGGAPILQRWLAPGHGLPLALDAWARMRGWHEAFAQLRPALPDGGPVRLLGTNRAVLAHGAYHWRDRTLLRTAWRSGARAHTHYELQCPWRGGDGGDWLVLAEGEPPADLAAALGGLQALARATVPSAAGETVDLGLWRPLGAPAPAAAQALCR